MGARAPRRRPVPAPRRRGGRRLQLHEARPARGPELLRAVDDRRRSIWPGATAQQMQDEVLNRMEKKFEQLDHFEKVVTFARQGYGGMTITVKGGTSQGRPARSLVPGAQEARDLKPRAARRRRRPDLQRRVRRRLRADVRRQGRRHRPRRAVRHGRGHQAPPAEGADGQEGRPARQAGQSASTWSSRTSAWPRSASRRWPSPRA